MIQENQILLNIYRKISLVFKIFPYVIMEERYLEDLELTLQPGISNIEVVPLNQQDISEIVSHREVLETADQLKAQIESGSFAGTYV